MHKREEYPDQRNVCKASDKPPESAIYKTSVMSFASATKGRRGYRLIMAVQQKIKVSESYFQPSLLGAGRAEHRKVAYSSSNTNSGPSRATV